VSKKVKTAKQHWRELMENL